MNHRNKFFEQCLVIDTETTDLDYNKAEIIELGFVVKYPEGWEMFTELCKPHGTISPEVSSICNITNKMVKDKPYFEDAISDLNKILTTLIGKGSIVAHNAFYDEQVIKRYKKVVDLNTQWICTMRLARLLYGFDGTVTNYKLPYLRYRFELEVPEDLPSHRAAEDALVTAKLLEHLINVMEERGLLNPNEDYRQQIENYCKNPILTDKMPFGKYKGCKFDDIPTSYITWAVSNLDTFNPEKENYDPDLTSSLDMYLDKILNSA